MGPNSRTCTTEDMHYDGDTLQRMHYVALPTEHASVESLVIDRKSKSLGLSGR